MERIRPARPEELALLPGIEAAADTMFEPLGIGPLPGPGTEAELAAALVVLVAGDPPVGFCRIDQVGASGDGRRAPTSNSSRSTPTTGAGAWAGPLLRAACAWAATQGFAELTLATYRDVPWNGPFYASEGFVEDGPVDDWLVARGLAPEEEVMGLGGVARADAPPPMTPTGRPGGRDFGVAEAADEVVVHEAGRLQVRVDDRGAHEAEAPPAQVLAQCLGLGGRRQAAARCPPAVHLRTAADEAPDVVVERTDTLLGRPGRRGRCAPWPRPWPGCG